jgi:uncharacterized protein with HEPN domain
MQRDRALVLDILAAARLLIAFTDGYDEATFQADLKTQSATLHQLMIIGEAVKQLSDEFRVQHADIPWRDIGRMRDLLIHHYGNVDLHRVWLTVTQDIPALITALEPLAPRDESSA